MQYRSVGDTSQFTSHLRMQFTQLSTMQHNNQPQHFIYLVVHSYIYGNVALFMVTAFIKIKIMRIEKKSTDYTPSQRGIHALGAQKY
jgi:hypothetical protein